VRAAVSPPSPIPAPTRAEASGKSGLSGVAPRSSAHRTARRGRNRRAWQATISRGNHLSHFKNEVPATRG
jgi:hypothetical protein